MPEADFEKLGAFYLGRLHDLEDGETRPDPLLYDAKDLTTHAVCVGMTGSGKTGLCLSLLEEAAIDGVPAIAIDPKGDLGNLLLAFPELRGEDFLPWIEQREAAAAGMTDQQYARQVAARWKEGLAEWGQDGERIRRYRSSVDISIYTPASDAGLPLTVLRSFDAPPAELREDADAYRERIATSVSGLLGLLGIDADPIRSKEHILLSNLLDRAWREGQNVDVGGLIQAIQKPPFDKIGILDLESIFPAKERAELAIALNNLLASPAFASWMEGEPLDVKRLLYTTEGRPRLSIVSIAHLSESERMFFVTILLNEVLAWVRGQPGTSSLRALLYMDEVFGYFPPVANPPSKTPMLTLLKQARAHGLGIVLATQNPVDLDYKGLSNIGTWFLGRLQTERDKARVLEGLEGAAVQAGGRFDRQRMEQVLAALGSRVFLMNNVHEDQPAVFRTRWALSYLRGPMTRQQIQTLMQPRKAAAAAASEATGSKPASAAPVRSTPPAADEASSARPAVPVEADECFVAPAAGDSPGTRLVYRPALTGTAKLHFVRATYKVDVWRTVTLLRPLSHDDQELSDPWEDSEILESELETRDTPRADVSFAPLPAPLGVARHYKSWKKDLETHLYREKTMTVWKCAELRQYSEPGEAEDDFRIRLTQAVKESRDLEIEKLRQSYGSKVATLKERIRKAEQRVERETSQYRSAQFKSVISLGSSVLGALLGRKLVSRTNVSKAGTAFRSVGRAADQHDDIEQAEETVEALESRMKEMDAELQQELTEVQEKHRPENLTLEALEVRPRKSDIDVERCCLVWLPWRVDSAGIAERAF